ncbi:MAG TPA: polysaccharide deacetylase family protein [Azospirillum sp.]|nr:polysaccharide deacetylase family protein [Azospirillum sp.]
MTLRCAVISLALAAWALVAPTTDAALAAEGTGAVVFAYSRFGEDQSPSSSIRIDQFESHIDELTTGGYAVLPLPRIIETLKAGKPLPDRAVAITIDDATRSFYTEAWPRLRAAGLPFTLFVATDPVDRGSASHMTWAELRQLQAAGVTIGGLGATTMSLVDNTPDKARTELRRMADRLQAELGRKPALFAYPEGEYSTTLQGLAGEQGFIAAFGQQSGVLHPRADFRALPRFVMNESYGSVERFRLAANALPLPVSDLTPDDPLLTVNPPPLGFTVSGEVGDLSRLACFASGQGRTRLERIEDRIEVRISDPFPPGRARVNCTLPTAEGRWRWFGVQFVVPEDDDD